MKVLFIEARKRIEKEKFNFKAIPKKIHILYTIQYKELAEKLKNKLKKTHKILGFDQILGCSEIKLKASPLLIGSGKFHALSLIEQEKEIFICNQGKINKISKQEIENFKKRQKGKLSKFLISENIGLLFSNKPGQDRSKNAEKIKKELKEKYKEKNFYIFISNTLDLKELENFPVDFWINLACPGLEYDNNKITNYKKLKIKI